MDIVYQLSIRTINQTNRFPLAQIGFGSGIPLFLHLLRLAHGFVVFRVIVATTEGASVDYQMVLCRSNTTRKRQNKLELNLGYLWNNMFRSMTAKHL